MNDKELAVAIIADSGNSKSYSLEALECMKKRNFEEAEELLRKSDEALLSAHKKHTELLVAEANGENIPFSLFLMHSESHLNVAEVTREYADAILHVYKDKGGEERD